MSNLWPAKWAGWPQRAVVIVFFVGSILMSLPSLIVIVLHRAAFYAQWIAAQRLLTVHTALLWLVGVIAMLTLHRLASGGFVHWLTETNPALAEVYQRDYVEGTRLPGGWRRWRRYVHAWVLAPIGEEIVFRALPLFGCPIPVFSGYVTVIAQILWALGHYDQVRPRTFLVRIIHVLVSAVVELTTVLVIFIGSHNIFWAVAASIAVHSLHNGFFYLWPWYAKYQIPRPVTG